MTTPTDEPRSKRLAWRIGTPMVFALSGALFVVSADNSEGTDLRPGRNTDLTSLVRSESRNLQALRDRQAELTREVDRLAAGLDDRQVQEARTRAEQMRAPAGYEAVTGRGITVTLTDAPREVRETSTQDINLLVVHQQDIQAVVNAMWRGGARAITIQGQRIISTTGIKCSGSSVELHGIPYAQPYKIQAIGNPDKLTAAIDADHAVQVYRDQAGRPDVLIGWKMDEDDFLTAPAYPQFYDFEYARPVG